MSDDQFMNGDLQKFFDAAPKLPAADFNARVLAALPARHAWWHELETPVALFAALAAVASHVPALAENAAFAVPNALSSIPIVAFAALAFAVCTYAAMARE